MMRQHVIRRIILGAFTVALALPGFGAAAAEKTDDFGSRVAFKEACVDNAGIFTDTGDGNLWCQHDDDSQTVCDEDGQDCYFIDSEDQEPSSPWGPTGPTDGVEPVNEGETDPASPVAESPAPAGDEPTASDPEPRDDEAGLDAPSPSPAQPSVVAPDDEPDQGDNTSKKGKGKKGKKGGKGRKK